MANIPDYVIKDEKPKKCRLCEEPATKHRAGLGEDWWHCEKHDQEEINYRKGMDWLSR